MAKYMTSDPQLGVHNQPTEQSTMLNARNIPKACQSCRLHLQSLFEHGFATSASTNLVRSRQSTSARLRSRTAATARFSSLRSFSTSATRREEVPQESSTTDPTELEAIVRRARRTFGQTLPKDYLSAEEYVLYERLYGPPVRETQPEDLELHDLEWEDGAAESQGQGQGKARNVLLRSNADGDFEEVELDSELGFQSSADVSDADLAALGNQAWGDKDLENGSREEDWEDEVASDHEAAQDAEGDFSGLEIPPELGLENFDNLTDEEIIEAFTKYPELAQRVLAHAKDAEAAEAEAEAEEFDEGEEMEQQSEPQTVNVTVADQREYDAIQRLRKDLETSMARPTEEEEDIDEEYEEEEEEEYMEEEEEEAENLEPYISSDEVRTHPNTMAGRSGTTPSTIYLPKDEFVTPFSEMLDRTNNKHLTAAAEKAFGGPGLPHSTATPSIKKDIHQKHIGLEAGQHRMSEIEADAYISSVSPAIYATVVGTLVEVRKRLGSEWLRNLLTQSAEAGPRVLDAGAAGVGAMAWREMLKAEWEVMKDDGIVSGKIPPPGKTTVLVGADTLRHRMSKLLDNTTFLPRLPDYVHASNSEAHLDGAPAQEHKVYDIIIAPHTLFPLKEDFRRKHMIRNLWSMLDPKGGVLILIEKGVPRGFEAIAGARQMLLDNHISSPESPTIANETQSTEDIGPFTEKEEGMIIAPCTNHTKCPMYLVPGMTSGRKDFCHFQQRYVRPKYLQQIIGASSRNHEDVKYSYVALRRGKDSRKGPEPFVQGDAATLRSFAGYEGRTEAAEAVEERIPVTETTESIEESEVNAKFQQLAVPRVLSSALKRTGHVSMDVCTPSGKLERWTVPKSFSKQAYRDARKVNWGDLWALGAKTRVAREPRLGKGKPVGKTGLKGIRDGKMGKGGKKVRKNNIEILMGAEGMVGMKQKKKKYSRDPDKRTKGGRTRKLDTPVGENDL
ncbi:hypothetical protein PVAG01_08486 [Phlyctema vagabunda]|uniref:Uncharacterized protein n=1 Tax=Phlyctema vagabunda TaxID=108571 RepID=A0ABR4P9J5_9HELO